MSHVTLITLDGLHAPMDIGIALQSPHPEAPLKYNLLRAVQPDPWTDALTPYQTRTYHLVQSLPLELRRHLNEWGVYKEDYPRIPSRVL